MKRALVIGSEGNIGKPLVLGLRESGVEVVEIDIRPGWRPGYVVSDITQPLDLLPAFDRTPDAVFLLSAMVSRVTCEQAAGLAISTNLVGLNNVVQLTKRIGAKLIYFSTSEVYGPEATMMDEESTRPEPNNRYGLSKLLGEQLVEYEVKNCGLRATTLRPFMIYDEHEDLGDHRSAMIRFTHNLAVGNPIDVHQGSARGWLHISDAVRAIVAAAQTDEYSVINIGHPDIVLIERLADMVCQRLGADPALINRRELPDQMTLIKNPSLDRMRSLLGVEPTVSLEAGVDRVCTRITRRLDQTEFGGQTALSQT